MPQVPHLMEIAELFVRHLENGRCRKVPQVPRLVVAIAAVPDSEVGAGCAAPCQGAALGDSRDWGGGRVFGGWPEAVATAAYSRGGDLRRGHQARRPATAGTTSLAWIAYQGRRGSCAFHRECASQAATVQA